MPTSDHIFVLYVSVDVVLLWRGEGGVFFCSNLHVWVRPCRIIDFVFTCMSLIISPTDNMHYLLNISHSYCGAVSLWENFVEECVSHCRDRYRDTEFWTPTTLPSSCHIVLQVANLNTFSRPMFFLLVKLPTLTCRHSYEWHVKRKARQFVWRDFWSFHYDITREVGHVFYFPT